MLSWFLFWTLCVGIMAEGCCSCIFMKACPKDVPLHEGCRVRVPTQLALLWAYCSSAASCGLTLPWWSSATGLELEKQQTNACLPFPNPGEAGGMKRARYSTLPSSLQAHGLCWLGWGDSTPKKSFRQAHAGQGWASSRVFCSLAASWSNEHSSATAPLGGADTSVVTVRQSCLQWMWGRWPVLKVCVCVCGGVYCIKTTAVLVLFTTRPGYLLPGKTWADLQWQKPRWSPADPRTKLTWCEATLSVTLLLPVDDKPGRGELPPSCYHPTAPFLRLEPQPFHTWSSHPSMYSQTQEQVSHLFSL